MKRTHTFILIMTVAILSACSTEPDIKSANNCGLNDYHLDCSITKYLEDNLAWTNSQSGVAFCTYETLDTQSADSYLQVLCEEYYPQKEKIVCPDEVSREACFMSKDASKKECKELCTIKAGEPYLVTGGGLSIPVRLTAENDGFTHWTPRDGSYYTKDLKENFTAKALKKLEGTDTQLLQSINMDRAEEYFGVKVHFEVAEKTETSCRNYSDCERLPMDYAIRSNCPYTMKCLNNQCAIVCYDFQDYTDYPQLEAASRE